jgi:hypothetical protein
MGMINITQLEKIADDFIESYLKETPEMVYLLYETLQEYIQEQQLNMSKDEILKEHSKIKAVDRAITDEDLDILERFWGKTSEIEESNLLLYFQSMPDPFIKELTALVMTSDKVKMRGMDELEIAEQEDPLMPNEWIYHKDSDPNKVSEYILEEYDMLRQEAEIEDGTDLMA